MFANFSKLRQTLMDFYKFTIVFVGIRNIVLVENYQVCYISLYPYVKNGNEYYCLFMIFVFFYCVDVLI
jgi:hypothetical protein